MTSAPTTNWKLKEFLLPVLFMQSIFYVSVFLNIAIVRQIFGVFYLTFLPGFVILKLLKLDKLNIVETILFSVGSSVVFLMLGGLLVNEFGFLFGISKPLSPTPLMIFLNTIILLCAVLVCLIDGHAKILESKLMKKLPLTLIFLFLPTLSVVGTVYMNIYGNNLLLLLVLTVISLVFIVSVLSKRAFPSNLYPFVVFMIAVSLLYHSSLVSKYVVTFGSDATIEYFLFKNTQSNAYWGSIPTFWGLGYGRINAMLSVTILPTIYSSLLNLDPTWMFKTLFPFLFAFVTLGLYQIWQFFIRKKYAFIATFLFMAQETFYTEMLGLNRQMIGELFFVLLLLTILNNNMKRSNRVSFFILFSFGLITSHYGLSEIFLFFIAFTFLLLFLIKKSIRKITMPMIALFFVIMFSWYLFTTRAAVFDSILEFGDYVYRQLGDFFNPVSRGQTVLRGLGLERPPTIWNAISRAFAYATQFLIVVGFIALLMKRVKVEVNTEFFAFTSIAMAFLTALIVVPGLAKTMNMTRFYHVLLFFLAPLCVLGAESIVKLMSREKSNFRTSVLLLLILVPYFLFQTNFVYEVVKTESWSVSLSGYRMSSYKLYYGFGRTDSLSVFSAKWIHDSITIRNVEIYGDRVSYGNVLRNYGFIYGGYINPLSNITRVPENGIIYLNSLNVVKGIVVAGSYLCNSSELVFLKDMNIAYSNGGSKIYKNIP